MACEPAVKLARALGPMIMHFAVAESIVAEIVDAGTGEIGIQVAQLREVERVVVAGSQGAPQQWNEYKNTKVVVARPDASGDTLRPNGRGVRDDSAGVLPVLFRHGGLRARGTALLPTCNAVRGESARSRRGAARACRGIPAEVVLAAASPAVGSCSSRCVSRRTRARRSGQRTG